MKQLVTLTVTNKRENEYTYEPVLNWHSSFIQYRVSCLGNGDTHSRKMSYLNLIKTIPRRHAQRYTSQLTMTTNNLMHFPLPGAVLSDSHPLSSLALLITVWGLILFLYYK